MNTEGICTFLISVSEGQRKVSAYYNQLTTKESNVTLFVKSTIDSRRSEPATGG